MTNMSLLRLLAAGKSLVGLESSESRYQLTRQRILPRFGAKKNPFRATASPEPPAPAASAPAPVVDPGLPAEHTRSPTSELQGAKQAVAGTAGLDAAETQLPVRETVGQGARNPKARELARSDMRQGASEPGKFTSRLNALFPWRRPEAPKPAIPRFAKPMVQAELSLETVKVVRNDLSDTDLEIVRAKRPPASTGDARVAQGAANRSAGETAWARVTGRLFGLGKT
jgi:hypothetical protein